MLKPVLIYHVQCWYMLSEFKFKQICSESIKWAHGRSVICPWQVWCLSPFLCRHSTNPRWDSRQIGFETSECSVGCLWFLIGFFSSLQSSAVCLHTRHTAGKCDIPGSLLFFTFKHKIAFSHSSSLEVSNTGKTYHCTRAFTERVLHLHCNLGEFMGALLYAREIINKCACNIAII